MDRLRALTELGLDLWLMQKHRQCLGCSTSCPNSRSPPQDHWHTSVIPHILAWKLMQGVCSAAVTSGSPVPGAVLRQEGAARCRIAPSGAFPTGIPSPACHQRRIYGYAVRTTSTPRGKSSLTLPRINVLGFILPPGYELIPRSGKEINQSCSCKRLMYGSCQ